MLKYNKIVDASQIGSPLNSKNLNELIISADSARVKSASTDKTRTVVLAIDFSNDFISGSLPVAGSTDDIHRFTNWLHEEMEGVTKIVPVFDTHTVNQVFFAGRFINDKGEHPKPFTEIFPADLADRKWIPTQRSSQTYDYSYGLERTGKKPIKIWPYHCIQGTFGCAFENQLNNMINYIAAARKFNIDNVVKGLDPDTEHYGIFRPEFCKDERADTNMALLASLEFYDRIVIAGQAMDICVEETIKQAIDLYTKFNPEMLSKIYVLTDCMSTIGDRTETLERYRKMESKYGIHLITTRELNLV
jgi:nicotinamidase-related amidase